MSDRDVRQCKNCLHPIVWSMTMNGARYGWFHLDNRSMECYPDRPVAEPATPEPASVQPDRSPE